MSAQPDSHDETAALLRDAAADFLAHEHSRERLRGIYQGESPIRREVWRQFAQQGWLSLRWPEALGGTGLDLSTAAVLAEQLGRHVVPEPFVASAAMPAALAQALAHGDAAAAWQALAEGCAEGITLTALAWQDDAQTLAPQTTARAERVAGGYRLGARKFGVVAASLADVFLVTAELEGAPALWQVPRDAAGVSMQVHPTSDGSNVAVVDFEGVQLPAQALLAHGPEVEEALERAIDEALVLTAAQLIGVADAALELTLDYLRTRVQFGRHIGSFQAMQHAAVDVRLQLVLARAGLRAALNRHAADPLAASTRAAIAAAKARASDAALQAGRFGVQAHGAIGFAAESDIGLYLKAALRLAAWLGNGSQQRERYGRFAGIHDEANE